MKVLIFMFVLLIPCKLFASPTAQGFGDIASNMLEPVGILSDFIGTASIIVGMCAIFAGFFRYMEYRKNPLVSPISTVILLIVIGVILVSLPFIYRLTESGIPYHLG